MADKRVARRFKEHRESSADAVFCDVIDNSSGYRASILSEMIGTLPTGEQQRILDVVELMIRQAKEQEHERNSPERERLREQSRSFFLFPASVRQHFTTAA